MSDSEKEEEKTNRVRRIKEDRRRQHAERLVKAELEIKDSLHEDESVSRFSKYRRSGKTKSSRGEKDGEGDEEELSASARLSYGQPFQKKPTAIQFRQSTDKEDLSEKPRKETSDEPSNEMGRENELPGALTSPWNVTLRHKPPPSVSPTRELYSREGRNGQRRRMREDLNSEISPPPEPMISPPNEDKQVAKKPSIPPILRSPEENKGRPERKKKPSILKKKAEGGSSGGQQVSFGEIDSVPHHSSSNRNCSGNAYSDSESGFWIEENATVTSILKNRGHHNKFNSFEDNYDNRSILKERRCSLGSSVLPHSETAEGLQGILKRKHSYDSSSISKGWASSSNVFSLSTPSLSNCESPEPKPILKKKSSSEELEESDPKPILKKKFTRNLYSDFFPSKEEKTIKPCLKKPKSNPDIPTESAISAAELDLWERESGSGTDSGRGILKKKIGILKHASFSGTDDENPLPVEDFFSPNGNVYKKEYKFDNYADHLNRLSSPPTFENGRTDPQRRVSEPSGSGVRDCDELFPKLESMTMSQPGSSILSPSRLKGTDDTITTPTTQTSPRSRRGEPEVERPPRPPPGPKKLNSPTLPPIKDFLKAKAKVDAGWGKSGNKKGSSFSGFDRIRGPPAGFMEKGEGDSLKRSESEEEILAGLSVADKRSLFMQMDRERRNSSFTPQTSAYKTKRSSTMPVTSDEVVEASKLVVEPKGMKNGCFRNSNNSSSSSLNKTSLRDDDNSGETKHGLRSNEQRDSRTEKTTRVNKSYESERKPPTGLSVKDRSVVGRMEFEDNFPEEDHKNEEEETKLSFRDRVQLFNKLNSPLKNPPKLPLRKQVTSKRFATQPVTTIEHLRFSKCGPSPTPEIKVSGGEEEGNESEWSVSPSSPLQLCRRSSLDSRVPHMPSKIPGRERRDSTEDSNESSEEKVLSPSFVRKKVSRNTTVSDMMMETEVGRAYEGMKSNRNSIAERVQALQVNGEISWKKRVSKLDLEKEVIKIAGGDADQNDNLDEVDLNRKNNKEKKSGVAARLSLLENAQEGWKKRVSENEALGFTVQGRLEKAGKITPSLILESKKPPLKLKSLMQERKTLSCNDEIRNEKEKNGENNNKFKRSVSVPQSQSSSPESGSSGEFEEKVERNVARNDNELFRSFFVGSERKNSRVEIEETDFGQVTRTEGRLLGEKRNIKPARKFHNSRNPVKALANRTNFVEETYYELNPQIREKNLVRKAQIDNLSKQSLFSVEALAGLASKEDFTAVRLKRAAEAEKNKSEFPHPMLIRIKGKRQVQSRLVPPHSKSLSSGDNFILVMPNKVYHYIGEYSNRMERSKAADVLAHIVQKRDLGCRVGNMAEVYTLEEPIYTGRRDFDSFFKILGGEEKPEDELLGDEADEAYEQAMISFNRVYEVNQEKEELVPYIDLDEGGWMLQPKHSILKDDKVLAFDFGSELYVWSGCKADVELKKLAFRLAKDLFNTFDTSETSEAFNPIPGHKSWESRPNWCWLKRINQHMEPILFIEKFFDWPDESGRIIRVKGGNDFKLSKDASFNFEPCDVEDMIKELNVPDQPLELEGFDVARGSSVYDELERRSFTITPISLRSWHICEFSKSAMKEKDVGHFYSGETYVIRWQYSVTQMGRDLKGNKSKHLSALGRERTVYFFWQGKDSGITEQGSSALMTVELDEEKGPQVRVVEGHEPPAFVALFKGLMFFHSGNLDEGRERSVKLYVSMGCAENEGHFIEVPAQASSFRSKGSFLLVDSPKNRVYLWHGCLSNNVSRKIGKKGAEYIQSSRQKEFGVSDGIHLIEIEEGEEVQSFLSCLAVRSSMKWRESYVSLVGKVKEDYDRVEVFSFSTLSGSFEAKGVFSPKRKFGSIEPFPLLQETLYSHQQPCLFLITTGSETWLWHGWHPRGDETNENTATGSIEYRWGAERRAALETGMNYAKVRGTDSFVVYAGLEPALFTNIFPSWKIVEEAREANLSEGRQDNGIVSMEQAMKTFLKDTYTFEELQMRPEGVDPLKLETYLSDSDFEDLLKMTKEEFNKLQTWKKTELKKQAGLF